jgi:hypothetical protein
MTVPGPDVPAPGVPAAQYPAPQYPAPQYPAPQYPAPPAGQGPSSRKKWLGIAGGVVVAGAVGANALGLFGSGTSEVGDCIATTSETDYETVDCDAKEAEFRIIGIDDQEMTYSDFEDAPIEDICVDFADRTEYALWEGDMITEPGTIYCAGPV